MIVEQKLEQEKEFFHGLIGKTIIAKVGNPKKRRPVVGEVVKGTMKIYYVCDESMNCIGKRQRKEIKLKEGEDIYLVLRDSLKRINSFYKLYPNKPSRLLEIGLMAY